MKSFFETFPITKIEYSEIDIWIEKPGFKILFLWGVNCPNCEIAKKVLTEYLSEVFEWEKKYQVKWYHGDVYDNFEWAHRFGLQGIPHFMIYKGSKRIGKITPFPGWAPFQEALEKVFTSF